MTWRLCTRYLCTNINIHEWARTRSSQHSSINLSSPAKANDTIANLWELKWRAGDGKIFRYIHPQDTFCIHKYQDTWQIPCSFELRYTVGCDMYIYMYILQVIPSEGAVWTSSQTLESSMGWKTDEVQMG